jgi:hypothetical protein
LRSRLAACSLRCGAIPMNLGILEPHDAALLEAARGAREQLFLKHCSLYALRSGRRDAPFLRSVQLPASVGIAVQRATGESRDAIFSWIGALQQRRSGRRRSRTAWALSRTPRACSNAMPREPVTLRAGPRRGADGGARLRTRSPTHRSGAARSRASVHAAQPAGRR